LYIASNFDKVTISNEYSKGIIRQLYQDLAEIEFHR